MDVATDPICRDEACHDAILGCEVACRDAVVGGTADITAGPERGVEAFRDAVLRGTVGVTTGP